MYRSIIAAGLFAVIVTAWSQDARAYTAELSVKNLMNEAGEVVVIEGGRIEVGFYVTDPNGETSKDDDIELYRIDIGAVVDSEKRGKLLEGRAFLDTTGAEGEILGVRYRLVNGQTAPPSENPTIIVVSDKSSQLLFERFGVLNQDLEDANGEIDNLQNTVDDQAAQIEDLQLELSEHLIAFNDHASNPSAHHTRYSNSEVDAYLFNQGVPWSYLRNVPDGLDDGDDNTQLTEAEVDLFVKDNGYLTSVEWNDINGMPLEIADGDNDTHLTEDEVDAYCSNNGYLTSLPPDIQGLDSLVEVEGTSVRFVGANVYVQSGSGSTYGDVNGMGNLIVGYDEGFPEDKTGSHNLVVGWKNSYTSYGGAVFGSKNSISGTFATVTGGVGSIASGMHSSVSGGAYNEAAGKESAVSGGLNNTAAGEYSSVCGSSNEVVDERYGLLPVLWSDIGEIPQDLTSLDELLEVEGTSVRFVGANVYVQSGSGSTYGDVNGMGNLIVGYDEGFPEDKTGSHNLVVGWKNSYTSYGGVVFGSKNSISGTFATVTGGVGSIASGMHSSVSGGAYNEAAGKESAVSGGLNNTAAGEYSSVCGSSNEVVDERYGLLPVLWSDIDGVPADIADGDQDTQLTDTQLVEFLSANDYITSSALNGYATQSWVGAQGYLTSADLAGNATQDWVQAQGYSTESPVDGLAQYVTVDPATHSVVFRGANVFVQNGLGSTEGSINSLGNLIVGYNESHSMTEKTGSHNLIVGAYNDYRSYGGVVFGRGNQVWAPYASLVGGTNMLVDDEFGMLPVTWSDIEEMPADIAALDDVLEIDGTDVRFVEANVYVQSGSGSTEGAINGLGNLIVGYDESHSMTEKTGSHNLVVGPYNDYRSYSGVVFGKGNQVWAEFGTITGGANSLVDGYAGCVLGGQDNHATVDYEIVPFPEADLSAYATTAYVDEADGQLLESHQLMDLEFRDQIFMLSERAYYLEEWRLYSEPILYDLQDWKLSTETTVYDLLDWQAYINNAVLPTLLTSDDIAGYATEAWVASQGYLTTVTWADILDVPPGIGGLPEDLEELDALMSVDGTDVYFIGANLHVKNGEGATDTVNGQGNLIVGYDEVIDGSLKTGSHNLIVGAGHSYSSYGGAAMGYRNNADEEYGTVTRGWKTDSEAFHCFDGIANFDESDIDCSGSCDLCADGAVCDDDLDCQSNLCLSGICTTIHDVAVISAWEYPDEPMFPDTYEFLVQVENQGNATETFRLQWESDDAHQGQSYGNVTLEPGEVSEKLFSVSASGLPPGTYTAKIWIDPLPGEDDTADNELYWDFTLE